MGVTQIGAVFLVLAGLYGIYALLTNGNKTIKRRVNWSPLEAIGVVVAVYLLAQLVGGVIVAVLLIQAGHKPDELDQLLRSSPLTQFGFIAAVEAISITMVYLFLKKRATPWSAIGWVRPRPVDLLYSALGFAGYFASYLVVTMLASSTLPGLDLNQRQDLGFNTATSGLSLVPVFLSLVILPPLVEEIVTRGVLFSGLRTKLPFITAALITSFLFALAHLNGGENASLIWVASLDTFILSMVLVTLRERTGSLWAGIGLHAIKNGIAFMALFVFHVT